MAKDPLPQKVLWIPIPRDRESQWPAFHRPSTTQEEFLCTRTFVQFGRLKGDCRSIGNASGVSGKRHHAALVRAPCFHSEYMTEWRLIIPCLGEGIHSFPEKSLLPYLHKARLKPDSHCRHVFCCHPRAWSYFRRGHWKCSLETLLSQMKQNIKQITPNHNNVAKYRAEFRQKPKYCEHTINCNDANLRDAPAARWVPCTAQRGAGTLPVGD